MGRTPLSPGSTPVDSDLLGATGTEHEVSQDNVIWGTTVNIQTSMATFRDFIHHYKVSMKRCATFAHSSQVHSRRRMNRPSPSTVEVLQSSGSYREPA